MHPNDFGTPLPSTQRMEQDRVDTARPVVRLLVILDKSLSMVEHQEQVTTSLRGFVQTLTSAPHQPRYVVTLVGFSNEAETLLEGQPIETLAIHYKADGEGTALWDALAHAFALEKSRRAHVICLIVSDGEENASRETDQRQIAAMVRNRLEWGNWIFLWLNLQGRPCKTAKALGITCVDSTRDRITEALRAVANQVCGVAARLTASTRRLAIDGAKR
jgi:Mg-chelatase subunit ChlD